MTVLLGRYALPDDAPPGRPVVARDQLFDVDVDVLRLLTPPEPLERARLLRHVRRAAGLSTPAVVRILDAGEHDGSAWIVLPHSGRGTLADEVRRAPVDSAGAVRIALQAVEGALALRSTGLLPVGLLPEQLVVDGAGQVQVLPAAPRRDAPVADGRSAGERAGGAAAPDEAGEVQQVGLLLAGLVPGQAPAPLRRALGIDEPYADLAQLRDGLREADRRLRSGPLTDAVGEPTPDAARSGAAAATTTAGAGAAGAPAATAGEVGPSATGARRPPGAGAAATAAAAAPGRADEGADAAAAHPPQWVRPPLVDRRGDDAGSRAARRRRGAIAAAALVLLTGAAVAGALTGADPDGGATAAVAPPASAPLATSPSASAGGAADPGASDSAATGAGTTGSGATGSGAAAAAPPATTPEQDLAEAVGAVRQRASQAPSDPAAADLLPRLREVAALEGQAQDSAAIDVLQDVRAAVAAGRLDPDLGARVTDALERVAGPTELVGLVRLARHDPSVLGEDGEELSERLFRLDHRVRGDDVPPAAADLIAFVRRGVAAGRLVPDVERVTVPVLEPLARTEPLEELDRVVRDLRRDPDVGGSGGRQLRERLDRLDEVTVYRRTLIARELLGDVRGGGQDGGVPEAFRERVVPVLQPLAQQAPVGS